MLYWFMRKQMTLAELDGNRTSVCGWEDPGHSRKGNI
jgi:hypothetical protein